MTSTHHHTEFVPDALGHVKPVKIGVIYDIRSGKGIFVGSLVRGGERYGAEAWEG